MTCYKNAVFLHVFMWRRKSKYTGTGKQKPSNVCSYNILFCKKKGEIGICVEYINSSGSFRVMKIKFVF